MSLFRSRIPHRTDIWPRTWQRRPLMAITFIALAAVIAYVRLQTPTGTDHDRYHDKIFTCVKVSDGDTIHINIPDGKRKTTKIRLWGVDTPETANSPKGEMYYGPQASAFTKSLVLNKKVRVVLAPNQTRGKYKRLLAYVYYGEADTMLNEELLIQGYAYADPRFDHPWKERFLILEDRARKQKIGLWAEVKPEQFPSWRQGNRQGRKK